MSNLKFEILGRYWDSFIYRGKLYLFALDGSVRTITWDPLVESLGVPAPLRLALECAFQRGDYLYGKDARDFFHDPEVRQVIQSKFERLELQRLRVGPRKLAEFEKGQQDNPLPFPHADCEVYDREMYAVGRSGLSRASIKGGTKHPVSSRSHRLWDGPTNRISASWGTLALAAGSEGLFDRPVGEHGWSGTPEPRRLVNQHCNEGNWTFHSIYGSSPEGGFLAAFSKEESQFGANRVFQRVLDGQELWQRSGYSWGVQDKLCLAVESGIEVLRYAPWEKNPEEQIVPLGRAPTRQWKGQVIAASVAPFGVVVELERALVVYPSRGRPVTIKGEPVNWRVFPRSHHYANQLHVVWDDRLEIHSFNHDYLVDQETKLLGIRVMNQSTRP
jgi:hypothetical protein